ncbi:MAG: HDOD domain-containing protein [Candidatus Hydrogenedentes bacterium]|nr:HDOD domain-containing protein [Candidatus Hydrogenedentota bacterium]
MLILTCTCGNRMKVPDDAIGKSGKCRKCKEVVKITAENTAADSPAVVPEPEPAPTPTPAKSSDPARKRIGELMLDAELITEGQLKEALEVQRRKGGKIVEVLISLSYLSVDAFVNFLARQPGIASLDLANYQIPADTVALVSKEIAMKHEVFPIDKMGRLLTLAMACPLDSATISQIEQDTGLRVKALLCSPSDIRTAINEYYPKDTSEAEYSPDSEGSVQEDATTPKKIESGLKLSGVVALVKQIKSLPAMPETVERVREAMDDLSISPSDVAETIQKDPPIVAKVLSVANSAAYGFPNRVDSIELAVALLGLREIYSIVMSAAVLNIFEKTHNFDYKIYWEEAMNCAAAAKIIATSCGREQNTSVFTAGLLHDIGRIALLEIVPEKYLSISSDLVGDELIEAEQKAIGIAHTEAGYELASNWNLPVEIAEPIRFHHHPEFGADAKDEVAVVALAESWTRTHALTEENREALLISSKPLFDMLAVDENTATQTFNQVAALERVRFTWSGSKVA